MSDQPAEDRLHEWAAIARDLAHVRTRREVVGYLFGPPGWSHDGSRRTTKAIKAEWEAQLRAAA